MGRRTHITVNNAQAQWPTCTPSTNPPTYPHHPQPLRPARRPEAGHPRLHQGGLRVPGRVPALQICWRAGVRHQQRLPRCVVFLRARSGAYEPAPCCSWAQGTNGSASDAALSCRCPHAPAAPAEDNAKFAKENNLQFPLLTDDSSILRKTFGIPGGRGPMGSSAATAVCPGCMGHAHVRGQHTLLWAMALGCEQVPHHRQ